MAKLRFIRTFAGFSGPILSLVLHFAVTLCFINRWDKATAVTVFPLWSWSLIGISIIVFSWLFSRNRFGLLVVGIWVVTAFVGADEVSGIVQSIKGKDLSEQHPGERGGQQVIRVATINCNNRSLEALREVAAYNPDVVLVQESPAGVALRTIAKEMYGEDGRTIGGWHCGIIANRDLKLVSSNRSPRFAHATLQLDDGRSIDLVSVHLKHAITRWDLWDPECWKTHYANRKVRRGEVVEILNHLSATHGGRPVLIGGDFNAPASDAIFNLLRQMQFIDSYRAAGIGWGNTFFNRLPLLRIDQQWSTAGIKAQGAKVFPSKNSDHRLLVCDYVLD